MDRILVTGANGFIGRHLCRQLIAAGRPLRAAVRKPFSFDAHPEKADQCLVGDLGPETDWTVALAGVDKVIHLAARTHILRERSANSLAAFRRVNVEGTRSLIRACRQAGVRRFVLLSSIKAVGEETGDGSFSEETPCRPVDAYGLSKCEAEQEVQALSAAAIEAVILRPPLVFGPGVGANFYRLLNAIERGMPLPLGSARNRRSLLYVGNLTSAIVRSLDHPMAAGQVFHVADDSAPSTRDLAAALAEAMGKPARLWPLPVSLLTLLGSLIGRADDVRRLTGSLVVSTSKIRGLLNWTPPFSMQESLAATVSWYKAGR